MDTQQQVGFASMRSFREAYRGHFFDRDTMRFFASRLCNGGRIIGGRFFITSEKKCFEDYRRVYHLREIAHDSNGALTINTAGEFSSVDTARTAARNRSKAVPS